MTVSDTKAVRPARTTQKRSFVPIRLLPIFCHLIIFDAAVEEASTALRGAQPKRLRWGQLKVGADVVQLKSMAPLLMKRKSGGVQRQAERSYRRSICSRTHHAPHLEG